MKKTFILATAVATALVATSCSNDDNLTNKDDSGKTRIALSAEDNNSMAVTRAGFTNQTRIVARIVSESREGGAAKCVKTLLSAAAQADGKTYSAVDYVSGNVRYWDDAHGRNSRLSVYAIAIPNTYVDTEGNKLDASEIKGTNTWSTTNATDNTITWTVKTTQAYADLAAKDLTFSNNIQDGNVGANGVYTWDYTNNKYPEANPTNAIKHSKVDGENTIYDGRLYFTQSATYDAALNDGPGHFDKGQMEFNHALTRIQVNLTKGTGFETAPFSISTMQVLGQKVSGTFDIKTATWTPSGDAAAIVMAKWTTPATGKAATYEAQMIPGYTFADDEVNALQLTIDGNTYYITNKLLRKALSDNSHTEYTTTRGNRYVFNISVAKNKIENITATIVPWNDVDGATTPVDNSHLTFSFYDNGNHCTEGGVNLYEFKQVLDKVYTDDSYTANPVAGSAYIEVDGLTKVPDTNKYTTSEFYQDNKTAYHFRSLNDVAKAALPAEGDKTSFTMTYGNNDYHWGAPMKTDVSTNKLPYNDTNGYLGSIAKGIVAASTTSTINLTEIHMMSQIVVKLTTPSGGAAVNLAGATVKITKFSKTGTVDMGSGKITPATSYGDMDAAVAVAKEGDTDVYSCTINVVPQLLKRGTNDADYVGITIHTTDNNEYYIVKRLSEIKGTAGSQVTNMQTNNDYITRWYPGHKYIYTFNITKTEIKNITATIVGWNEVVAGSTDLDLEK